MLHALRRIAAGVVLAAALAGCSSVVGGAGHLAAGAVPGGGSAGGGSAPSSTPPRPTGCPRVVYAAAKLSFDCIDSGMHAFYQGRVWPVSEQKTVEASDGWLLDEGAGHWGSPMGQTLAQIALNVRQQMLDGGDYGISPTVRTTASRPTTIDGAPAYLVQTTFVINPTWARQEGTHVKQERLWIVAIRVAPGDVSLWYVSVPDLVQSLWAKVPSTMASIKVG